MRVLVAIELDDDDVTAAYGNAPWLDWDDMCASLDARFSEFFMGSRSTPVRGHLLAACDVSGPDALRDLLDAAEVGAEGIEPPFSRYHVEGSLATFRQHAEAQGAL